MNYKELIWLLVGVNAGISFCSYNQQTNHILSNSTAHFVHKQDFGTSAIKVLIASNPTCTACVYVDELLEKLQKIK